MQTVIFIVVVGVWLFIAALHETLQRVRPWHATSSNRGRAVLVRSLLKVRRGIALLYWLFSIGLLTHIAVDLWPYPPFGLPLTLWVIVLAGAAVLVSRVRMVQEWALDGAQYINQNYGKHLGWVRTFFRLCEAIGRYVVPNHPVVSDKSELARLVEHQHRSHQALGRAEQRQITKMLRLDERSIREKVIRLKDAHMIKASETIGPLLLSDLHNNPHQAFLVYEKKRATPVGVLEQSVAMSHANHTAKVASLMSDRLTYLPDDATQAQALGTFIETSAPISVIIDDDQQPVGVLYPQDILRDLFEPTEDSHTSS